MKYKAVIFDLFGTLVDVYSRRQYENMVAKMSSVLSIPYEKFNHLWLDTAEQRGTGFFQSHEANIRYICEQLGVSASDAKVKETAAVRLDFTRRAMTSDRGAMEVVSDLKSKGYRIALVSNCSLEAPVIWEDLPFAQLFDVTIFSCLVGLRKPDPRIYKLAVERLGVKPEDCLYIGDGDGDELLGAASVGLHPVLIRGSDKDTQDAFRDQAMSQEWNGSVISSLKDILTLL